MAHRLTVPAHFGIRSEKHKLIFFYGLSANGTNPTPPAWEFYDLEKDPREMKNEYDNPDYAEVISQMKTQLKETREALKEDDTHPKILEIIKNHWED